MATHSKIEWTESTWNPVTGCTKISEGCRHCYAERLAIRLQAMGNPKYSEGFKIALHPESLDEPIKWKKPSMIFVNSMSDLFHKDIPVDYIKKVFSVMNTTLHHTYQVLTKREDRLRELAPVLTWTPNIWIGVTVENNDHIGRIDALRTIPASIRFISFEPLLGSIDNIDFSGIHWAIVGGESGPMSREMKEEWVLGIKEQCEAQNVLFYFKQWGGVNKKASGRKLLGQTWDAMPEVISKNEQVMFA